MQPLTFYIEGFIGALIAQLAMLVIPWRRLIPHRKKPQQRVPDTPAALLLGSTFQILVVMVMFTLVHVDPTGAVAAMVVVTVYRCWPRRVKA